MSVRYIFNGEVLVGDGKVWATFEKKAFHSWWTLLLDKVFSRRHQHVSYDEEDCRDFYHEILKAKRQDRYLPHGMLDEDQFVNAFRAIQKKKRELGISLERVDNHRSKTSTDAQNTNER